MIVDTLKRIPQTESKLLGLFWVLTNRTRNLLSPIQWFAIVGILLYNDSAFLQQFPFSLSQNLPSWVMSIAPGLVPSGIRFFPSVFHWIAFLIFVLYPAAMLFDWSVLWGSQIKATKDEAAKNDRDPIYREARHALMQSRQNAKTLERIEQRLEDME